MRVEGDYEADGYAHVRSLVTADVAAAFLRGLKEDLGPGAIPLSRVQHHVNLLKRPAFEVYGHHYKPMLYFLWGLTPAMREITGRDLVPTYDYFRIYRQGDVCRVHFDRQSCEHSLSLTLAYSDAAVWDLQVGRTRHPEPSARVEEDFGDEPFSSVPMQVGDAVLYRGVHHRHGRIQANPNRWSAHLFLHWVDRAGPFGSQAFDGRGLAEGVDFSFA